MKLLVTRDWLRAKILTDPDVDTDAGVALALLEDVGLVVPIGAEKTATHQEVEENVRQLRVAFGTLLRQLRTRDQLTVAELASRAMVEEDEIRRLEHDPQYTPRPRTIHQLAKQFKLPVRKLMQMCGITRTVDRVFYDTAVRFAARSADLSRLSDEERQALFAFVSFMNKREDEE